MKQKLFNNIFSNSLDKLFDFDVKEDVFLITKGEKDAILNLKSDLYYNNKQF